MPTAKYNSCAYTFLIAAIVAAAALLPFAAGQFPSLPPASPAPGPDCFTALLGLSDCLSYVQNGSTLAKPDPACCPELKTLVDTQPICLCTLLGNTLQIPIDLGKALELPALCNQTLPPLSSCGASDTPPIALPPSEGPAPPPTTEGEGPATPPTEEITPTPSPSEAPAPVSPGAAPAPVSPGAAPAPVEVPSDDQSLSSALRMTLTRSLLMGVAAILFSYLLY